MARRSISCIYSVLQVKPFSGYYRSCPTCERKLGTLEFNYSIPLQKTRYWCRSCCVDWNSKELGLSYCLILTVTNYPSGTKVVSLFGRALEPIFGLSATQMHKYLDVLEGGEMSKHELLLNALRTLLIGACVELRFARGSDTGQVMNRSISNGIKILGGNEETVLTLLSARTKLPQCHKSFVRDLVPEERDTNNLTAANDSSFSTTQHNSEVHHDSSSFLYDTKSQRVGPTNHPLQLESFLETQNRCDAPSQYISDSGPFGVDEVPDVEASQQIILELESEWENTQQIHKQQLPGDLDFDLAMSEEMVSELQQTFDLSGDVASTPEPGAAVANYKRWSLATTQAPDVTFTGLNIITPLSRVMSKSLDSTIVRTMPGYGTPELFSSCKPSHKKLSHLRGGAGEHSLSSSFSPELFGPTPTVCHQLSSSPEPANICTGATPPGLRRSRLHTPKRSLLHDSTLTTPTLLCQAAAESQVSRLGTRPGNSTPQTESKESPPTLSYTVSSPDLFS